MATWTYLKPFLSYYLLIPFILGIVIENYLPNGFCTTIGILFLVFTGIILYLLFNRSSRLSTLLSLQFLILSLGILSSFNHRHINSENWYGRNLNNAECFLIKIESPPIEKENFWYMPVEVIAANVDNKWQHVKGRIKMYVRKESSNQILNVEDQYILPNKIVIIDSPKNPGSFDYQQYSNRQNFYHQVFISQKNLFFYGSKGEFKPLTIAKNKIQKIIEKNIEDQQTKAIINAIILNERNNMEEDLLKAYSITGIVHIIAISGMHITLFFSIVVLGFFWIKNPKYQWIKYAITLPLIWAYIFITGHPASAVRSAIMFTILAFAIISRQPRTSINILGFTGFIMLIINPNWLFDVGAQLSFLAVLSILIFNIGILKVYNPRNLFTKYFWNIISISISVQILVFPLVILYFNQFPLLSLIANIPASLFSTIIMGGALLIIMLGMIGIDATFIGATLQYITNIFNIIIHTIANYTPTFLQQIPMTQLEFWLMMIIIILVTCYIVRISKHIFFSLIFMSLLYFTNSFYSEYKALKQEKIIVYNTKNTSLIEIMKGRQSLIYSSKDLDKNTITYILNPSHLNNKIKNYKVCGIGPNKWLLRNCKIIYWYSTLILSELEQNDVLIIHNSFPIHLIEEVPSYTRVILDGSIGLKKGEDLVEKIKLHALNYHWVKKHGAYIIE